MEFSIICALVSAVVISALAVSAVTARRAVRGLKERLESAENKAAVLGESLSAALSESAAAKSESAALRSQLESERRAEADRKEAIRTEFRAMASEILEEKTRQIGRADRESLESLLKPFRENMENFRRRVEQLNSEGSQRHGALENEIKNLRELNRRITAETENLTAALKGNSKVQGDFGEMILETILEQSQLRRGVHFTIQESLRDERGNLLRPDVILRLPEGKSIIIDSKVSLTAYVDYVEAADEESREAAMKRHLASMRKHVSELAAKCYQNLLPDTPDFVIMFLANEAAFLAALGREPGLWEEAYRRKVIISSPTNLFALLKLTDDLWKRDDRNRYALEIAEEGGRLYDKFVGFLTKLSEVEHNINRAAETCREAVKQLGEGRGNLIGRAERLRRLGVKNTKRIPQEFMESSRDDCADPALEAGGDGPDDAEVTETSAPPDAA